MDSQYLMGNSDGIHRSKKPKSGIKHTNISERLYSRLLRAAIEQAVEFYQQFFDLKSQNICIGTMVSQYERDLEEAKSFGLFTSGGVREKDHLNFWCLSHVLNPNIYIESGVYVGSSLHAFLVNSSINTIVAIDPRLDYLKIDKEKAKNLQLVDNKDYSELSFDVSGKTALAYFDDHINCAQRIIQSSKKGVRFLAFDDSTGLEGVCQRLYPPIPTIPMIVNHNLFEEGDKINWKFTPGQVGSGVVRRLYNAMSRKNDIDLEFQVNESFISQCRKASSLIKRVSPLPDLGYYLPQSVPEKMVDTTKYILELNSIENP